MIEVLDPGYSQFRGLTLFELFRGEYLLQQLQRGELVAGDGSGNLVAGDGSGNLVSGDRSGNLVRTLELCIRCLAVESESSTAGRVCRRAREYLNLVSSLKEE